jgi:hypothetical protein
VSVIIVIVDMREVNGQIVAIQEGQWLAQFASEDDAEEVMAEHILGRFPRVLLDLDDHIKKIISL